MNDDAEKYILDTSALLTLIEDEDGSDDVETVLKSAEDGHVMIYITFVTLTEIYYITLIEKGETEARLGIKLIKSLAVTIVESNEDLNLRAGKLKSTNSISLADAYIAALNQRYEGILVHKDPEFEDVTPPISEKKLPYKISY